MKYGEVTKGMRKIYIIGDDGVQKEYAIPRGVHINVQEGERVRSGDPLMDGPRNPHDILAVLGEKELQKYLVNEIQEVYRLQGVNINDKHLEVISRQMMRWVKVEDIGDTEFLPEEVVDKFKFREENNRVIEAGGRPATGKPMLLGITKASLSTDSFISAASFQETTRVLTEAAINGKVDYLRGLKENVIMGRLIPAGTGMEYYRRVKIAGRGCGGRGAAAGAGSLLRRTACAITPTIRPASTPADCPTIWRPKRLWPPLPKKSNGFVDLQIKGRLDESRPFGDPAVFQSKLQYDLAITDRRATGSPVTMHLPAPSYSSTSGMLRTVALNSFRRASQRGIVLDVRHDELAAAFFGGDVAQDRLRLRRSNSPARVFAFSRSLARVVADLVCMSSSAAGRLRRDLRLRHGLLRARIAPLQHDVAGCQIARPEFEHHRHAAALPVEELRARRSGLRDRRPSRRRPSAMRCAASSTCGLLFVLAIDRHQHGFDRRELGRQHQALVVGVAS